MSRSSLWTDFDCLDGEKTRVYFERTKYSPINLSLDLWKGISSRDPFFQIIPHATGRLKSLSIEGPSQDVGVATSHLSHSAPLLKHLSISSSSGGVPDNYPALPPALFNGDLSSLRTLCLGSVRTELPWRNMVNLTSFTLSHTPPGVGSIGRLLDFFENAPYLENVELRFATTTAGSQNCRLVSLVSLKSMRFEDNVPPSVLLDHLLIPEGAELEIEARVRCSLIGGYLPRSLDNLKNLSNFTTIQSHLCRPSPRINFSGPNGKFNMILRASGGSIDLVLEFLAELDTSKTEWFEIDCGRHLSGEPLYRVLLPMKDLRTLTLHKCERLDIPIRALQPATSSLEVAVCPKLEELVLVLLPYERMSHITCVVEMAAARASRGEKLRTFRIVGGRDTTNVDISELRKHVWNVEFGPWVSL